MSVPGKTPGMMPARHKRVIWAVVALLVAMGLAWTVITCNGRASSLASGDRESEHGQQDDVSLCTESPSGLADSRLTTANSQEPARADRAVSVGEEAAGERLKHIVLELEAAFDANDTQAKFALCTRARELFLSVNGVAAEQLLDGLSVRELIHLAQVINFARSGELGRQADLDQMSKYPASMVEYMVAVANGRRGQEAFPAALYFFQFCRDCPESVYEAGIRLAIGGDPEQAKAAILQLSFADPLLNPGASELQLIVEQWTDMELRSMALQALCRRATPQARQLLLRFLSSPRMDEVHVGLQGVLVYYAGDIYSIAAPDERADAELVRAIDSIYGTLDSSYRRLAAISIAKMPSLDVARSGLAGLATAEPSEDLRGKLLRASEAIGSLPIMEVIQMLQ